jgi:putative membrane protein
MLAALLHPGRPIDWLAWTVHPSTVIGIAALGALYAWRSRAGGGRLAGGHSSQSGARRSTFAAGSSAGAADHSSVPSGAQKLSFASGLLVLFAALNGPIHDLSDYYLFSAHMVQHLLLTLVVTPLLIAGTPGGMLRPLVRGRRSAAIARIVTSPGLCFAVYNVTLIAWHLPPLYNLAMARHAVHIVQHLCFLAASTLMWWPLMAPLPELPRLSYPKQMLYVVALMLPMSVVGMYLTYAERPLYPAYESAPRIWGVSPLEDQLIGGLIMWIPGGFALMGVATVAFFRWAASEQEDAIPGNPGAPASPTPSA